MILRLHFGKNSSVNSLGKIGEKSLIIHEILGNIALYSIYK